MSKKASRSQTKAKAIALSSKLEQGKTLELKVYPRSWYYICALIYLCYCYAAFVPTGPVWGIHFIAYIPAVLKYVLLVIGGLFLIPSIQRSLFFAIENMTGSHLQQEQVRIVPAAIFAVLCFVLFRIFTISTDIYGDNIYMLKEYGANSAFDWKWIGDIFSPHWVDNKEALTVAVHRIIAYVFSISIESSYQIMSEVCGALFIFLWLWFVQKITSIGRLTGLLRMVLMLLGVFAGAVLVFFGHVENYSFGILTFTIFLIALYFYVEQKLGTVPFALLYLLALKAHIVGILFLPAFLVAIAYRYRKSFHRLQLLFTWRHVIGVVVLPVFLFGLACYFFLFHSWNEPYAYTSGRQFQQSFLPVITLPSPLDHYSLWSPYHIADFFNLLLLTSAPIVVLLANLMIFNRKEILWSDPKVIIFGLAALFPLLFFAAMNPLLSPVRDWDVYTLLFPPLLFFASILLNQKAERTYVAAWLAQTFVFGVLFTTAVVAVNSSSYELQTRLQDAGAYTYHSYYAGSDYIEARAISLNDAPMTALSRFSNILLELSAGSNSGTDGELASMMSRVASLDAHFGDDSAAIIWATRACKTDTRIHRYVLDLAGYYVQANRLDEGSRVLKQFLKNRKERNDGDTSYLEQLGKTMAQLAARYSRTANDSLTISWGLAAREIQPFKLKYTYDLADYYMQTNRPREALDLLKTIPPDSVSVEGLTTTAIAEANAFGPDSGLPYLYKAKGMAPNNASVDSMIMELKAAVR